MCVQCVSQSLPYVAVALGGLRLASSRRLAGRNLAASAVASDEPAIPRVPDATTDEASGANDDRTRTDAGPA